MTRNPWNAAGLLPTSDQSADVGQAFPLVGCRCQTKCFLEKKTALKQHLATPINWLSMPQAGLIRSICSRNAKEGEHCYSARSSGAVLGWNAMALLRKTSSVWMKGDRGEKWKSTRPDQRVPSQMRGGKGREKWTWETILAEPAKDSYSKAEESISRFCDAWDVQPQSHRVVLIRATIQFAHTTFRAFKGYRSSKS